MSNRNQQNQLLDQLKKLRPNLTWPKTYQFPNHDGITPPFASAKVQIDQSQYINKPVYITVNQTSKSRRVNRREKAAKRLERIEADLYEKYFKRTPLYVILWLTITLLCLLAALGTLMIWPIELVFVASISALGLLWVIWRESFTFLYNRIERTTDFYKESVTNREQIKWRLQNREWGKRIMSFGCKWAIGLLLETDKRQAKRKKR